MTKKSAISFGVSRRLIVSAAGVACTVGLMGCGMFVSSNPVTSEYYPEDVGNESGDTGDTGDTGNTDTSDVEEADADAEEADAQEDADAEDVGN